MWSSINVCIAIFHYAQTIDAEMSHGDMSHGDMGDMIDMPIPTSTTTTTTIGEN